MLWLNKTKSTNKYLTWRQNVRLYYSPEALILLLICPEMCSCCQHKAIFLCFSCNVSESKQLNVKAESMGLVYLLLLYTHKIVELMKLYWFRKTELILQSHSLLIKCWHSSYSCHSYMAISVGSVGRRAPYGGYPLLLRNWVEYREWSFTALYLVCLYVTNKGSSFSSIHA